MSVPDPAHTMDDPAPPELWSVAEEGARRRLAAQGEQVRGWVSRETSGGSWLRALREAEKLQRPLRWTAYDEGVNLSEDGAHQRPTCQILAHVGVLLRHGRHI